MNINLRASIAENFKNTELGLLRIKRNLQMDSYSDSEKEKRLREIILSTPLDLIESKGKITIFDAQNIMRL